MARSSAVPRALERCARVLDGVAEAGSARVVRLGGVLQQVNRTCRDFVAVADSLAAALANWSSSLGSQAKQVADVGAAFAAADASSKSFVAWRGSRPPIKRGALTQPLWGRGDAPWEPSWDLLDPSAPVLESAYVDEFAASSELDGPVAGLVTSRVAFIRTRTYSDGSVDVTVGCDRLVGVSPGSSLGASITTNGHTVGDFAGVSGLLGHVESEAMTWRFAQPSDAKVFENGVRMAHRKHWDDNYGRWQALRDFGGLGMVHAYADAGFWKEGLALDPYPSSFQRTAGTQLSAAASLVLIDSSAQAVARFDQPTTVEWDFRRRRTSVSTVNEIRGGVVGSNLTYSAHAGAGPSRADGVVFDAKGRLVMTETRISESALAGQSLGKGTTNLGGTIVTTTRTDLRRPSAIQTSTSSSVTSTGSSDHTDAISISLAVAGGSSSIGERDRSARIKPVGSARTTTVPQGPVFAIPAVLLPLLLPPKLGKKRTSDNVDKKVA